MRAPANSLTKKAPYKGRSADSGEKHEPASDIQTSGRGPETLDPTRPIREADIGRPEQKPVSASIKVAV